MPTSCETVVVGADVSRALRQFGHEPRIIPAIYVKPFVKGQKNDYNDAEAIAEAALRPNLRTVREKTQDQLDLQACHRVRSRLLSRRTATINQIRAFLIEQGIAVRTGSSAGGPTTTMTDRTLDSAGQSQPLRRHLRHCRACGINRPHSLVAG